MTQEIEQKTLSSFTQRELNKCFVIDHLHDPFFSTMHESNAVAALWRSAYSTSFRAIATSSGEEP